MQDVYVYDLLRDKLYGLCIQLLYIVCVLCMCGVLMLIMQRRFHPVLHKGSEALHKEMAVS